MFNFLRSYSTEPEKVQIESKSPSSLLVKITPNAVTLGVTVYKVSTTGRACEVEASASPLECELDMLGAAREFTVEAKACASHSECSTPATTKAWTLPNCTWCL